MKMTTKLFAATAVIALTAVPAFADSNHSRLLDLMTTADNDSFAGSASNGEVNQTGTTGGGVIVERVDTNPTYAAVLLKAGNQTGNVGVSEADIANNDVVSATRTAGAQVGNKGVLASIESNADNTGEVTATGDNTLVGAASGIKEEVEIVVVDTRRGPSASVSGSIVSGNAAGGTSNSTSGLSALSVKQSSNQSLTVEIERANLGS